MNYKPISIRTFLGSKDFKQSRKFYTELGFKELEIDPKMSYFIIEDLFGFYLQDYYVKDWIENSMVFLELENLDAVHQDMIAKDLPSKYKKVKLTAIKNESFGRAFNILDPAGNLWHFGEFFGDEPS